MVRSKDDLTVAPGDQPGLARLERLHTLVNGMEDALRRGDTNALTELCGQATAAARELQREQLPPEALAGLEELHIKYARLCLIMAQQRQEMQQGMAHLRQGMKTLKVYRENGERRSQ